MKNPFGPTRGAPAAPSNLADVVVMGRPVAAFSSAEKSLIDEMLARHCDILRKEAGSRIFVDELIITAIEIQRGDKAASELVEGEDGYEKKIKAWEQRRDKLMARHIAALKAIGAMPQDGMNEESEMLADVYVRYAKEVMARRQRGTPIGQISANAAGLGTDKGLKVEQYQAATIPEPVRLEVVAEMAKQGGFKIEES